ncbi:MAG TPA: hypothetical protein ENK12_08235 [Gammaproteobacteria bacterium]|nr:hypothetical protein [Gammaproteobacteria bacterium]
MGEQVQKILSLWLVLALLMAPVPAFSAPAPVPGSDHCMSRMDAGRNDDQATTACRHCQGNDCQSHACGDSGCSPCHATGTPPDTPLLSLIDFSQALYALPAARSPSRADPPPLRPPL